MCGVTESSNLLVDCRVISHVWFICRLFLLHFVRRFDVDRHVGFFKGNIRGMSLTLCTYYGVAGTTVVTSRQEHDS